MSSTVSDEKKLSLAQRKANEYMSSHHIEKTVADILNQLAQYQPDQPIIFMIQNLAKLCTVSELSDAGIKVEQPQTQVFQELEQKLLKLKIVFEEHMETTSTISTDGILNLVEQNIVKAMTTEKANGEKATTEKAKGEKATHRRKINNDEGDRRSEPETDKQKPKRGKPQTAPKKKPRKDAEKNGKRGKAAEREGAEISDVGSEDDEDEDSGWDLSGDSEDK